jgi:hypothetical protein
MLLITIRLTFSFQKIMVLKRKQDTFYTYIFKFNILKFEMNHLFFADLVLINKLYASCLAHLS